MGFGLGFKDSSLFTKRRGHEDTNRGPWEAQQPYLTKGFYQADQLYNQGLDPSINRGYGLLEDVAQGYNPQGYLNTGEQALQGAGANLGMGYGALNTMLDPNQMLNPDANPYLGRYADAMARPITQNLTERILPAIRSDAISSGGYGGSRQGIAEGIAARGAAEAIGDRTAQLYSGAYGQGLSAMQGAAGMLPGYAQTNLGIAEAAPRLGNASFNLQRLPADAMVEAGMGRTQAPWMALNNYLNAIRGNYGEQGRRTYRDVGHAKQLDFSGSLGGS